jgi:N-acetylmuramic acid 6-phosphate (MurNAc-6-P) etherase
MGMYENMMVDLMAAPKLVSSRRTVMIVAGADTRPLPPRSKTAGGSVGTAIVMLRLVARARKPDMRRADGRPPCARAVMSASRG